MGRAVDPTPRPTHFSEALSSLEPQPSGLHPESLPQPRRGREGLGVTYLLGHQAGDAHGPPHPAFLDPGLQGPRPARFPGRGRHGGRGRPQPACPGAPGPASASPAPQRQSQPRLCPRDCGLAPRAASGMKPAAGAGPWGRGHPGSERGQRPAWLGLPMVRWCRPCRQGAALCLPPAQPAQQRRRGGNRLLRPAPPPPRSPPRHPARLPRPAAPSPAAAPGSRCSHCEARKARSPYPSSSPGSLACHRRLMGSLTPPPRRSVECPASQTDTRRWRECPETGRARSTRTRTHRRTRRPRTGQHTLQARLRGRADAQAPGGNDREVAGAGGGKGRQPDLEPDVRGNVLDSRPRGWRPGRDPESQRWREQAQEQG